MSRIVVLCHIARPVVWDPVVDWLAAAERVTFLDVPGFGKTPLPPGLPPSVETLARGVLHELEERRLTDCHVVGLSLGGSVALELARIGGVRSVSAISPPGFWSRVESAQVFASILSIWAAVKVVRPVVVAAGKVPVLRNQVWNTMMAHPDQIPTEVADELILGLPGHMHHLTDHGRESLRWAQAVLGYRVQPLDGSVPVTVAWGDKDRFTSYRSQAPRAREVLPHARHVTLRGCGHFPMYDDPEQVARVVLQGLPA